jgi:transcriptional regulator with XRE-family HTH domain
MTNLAFTALIKSKGYNKQRLADVCGLSRTQMSNRINGANDWRWPEVSKVCAALGITLDDFATYFPAAAARRSTPVKPKSDREQLADALQLAADLLKKA